MEEIRQNLQSAHNQDFILEGKKKAKENRTYGKILASIVLSAIMVEYYLYVFQVMVGNLTIKNSLTILILILIFHIFLFMMLWAFYTTMSTGPGEIPLYWGFYIGDDDYKRKRYCLICNAFKPERCHHCSVCNVCVLNMDHHCPWVINCIGFYNRKFFMQLLFYVSLTTIYVDISEFYFIIDLINDLFKIRFHLSLVLLRTVVLIGYAANFVFSIVITMFLQFHIKLVINNSTTIESLDKYNKEENARYNIGFYNNWIQVFGSSKLHWFLPIVCKAGAPDGDGLTWKTNENYENFEQTKGKMCDKDNQEKDRENNYETLDNKGVFPIKQEEQLIDDNEKDDRKFGIMQEMQLIDDTDSGRYNYRDVGRASTKI